MFIRTLINRHREFFIESLQLSDCLVPNIDLFLYIRILVQKCLVFELIVLSPSQSHLQFVEIICKLGVVIFESSDLTYVEIEIIRSESLRDDALFYLSLNLVLISGLASHFNNKNNRNGLASLLQSQLSSFFNHKSSNI